MVVRVLGLGRGGFVVGGGGGRGLSVERRGLEAVVVLGLRLRVEAVVVRLLVLG